MAWRNLTIVTYQAVMPPRLEEETRPEAESRNRRPLKLEI